MNVMGNKRINWVIRKYVRQLLKSHTSLNMTSYVNEFRARIVEAYMRSYMLARGGDAVVLLREEHATIAMNGKKNN
jgi:hypothetical protein